MALLFHLFIKTNRKSLCGKWSGSDLGMYAKHIGNGFDDTLLKLKKHNLICKTCLNKAEKCVDAEKE